MVYIIVMMKLVLFAMLLMVVTGDGTWKVIQRDFSFGPVASLSFNSAQTGWMVGGDRNGTAFLLHTEDGGATLTRTNMSGLGITAEELSSISMFDHKHGVAGWTTLAGFCGSYTNDGVTWRNIVPDGFSELGCMIQDTKSPTPGVFILIGTFIRFRSEINGIQISIDSGKTWTVKDWKQGITVRYGWFKDAKTGIVTGGETPGAFHGSYKGLIASTVDGGSSWKTMQNWTDRGFDGVCFNQVSCIDERTCWTVAEGLELGFYVAYIFSTTDGFATIHQQLKFENGYLEAIQMVNATFGWAAGADQDHGYTGHFFRWDGKTWTDAYQVADFYAYDISVIDSNYAYAVGTNGHHDVDLARYSPFN